MNPLYAAGFTDDEGAIVNDVALINEAIECFGWTFDSWDDEESGVALIDTKRLLPENFSFDFSVALGDVTVTVSIEQ